jgi:hypothetical protein
MGSAAHIKQDPQILPEPQLDITSSSRHHFIFLNETQRRLWYYPPFYTILHSHHLYAGLGSEPQPPSTTLTSRFAHEYPHPSHRAVLSGSTCRTPPSFSLVYTSLAQERFICTCRSRSGCFLSTLLSAKNTLLGPWYYSSRRRCLVAIIPSYLCRVQYASTGLTTTPSTGNRGNICLPSPQPLRW